ncbi:hypothetical protein JNB63_20000 [Microbacterium trichothecenolyticum]|uniref:Uncharacterized protein n=1 Tax=Microbacterium ureisolvens TaxID=2781186 RepID=A0ABS7I5P9_9MICO|nr:MULTISPECIES: hypothetical protein [Microbacterium]MBW9111950.1 hypothetical protein [Microbacterium ureisolvens]MBW9122381.1 hypothetical protein [Microbacterium trichothecenolyticum]
MTHERRRRIYRVDDADRFTVIANLGDWSAQNPPPPDIDFFLARGVQYAMHAIWGGPLVTDGHHNRVLRMSMSGDITLVEQFGNIVPTGITALGPLVSWRRQDRCRTSPRPVRSSD